MGEKRKKIEKQRARRQKKREITKWEEKAIEVISKSGKGGGSLFV